jgi:hypothetical protein
VLDVPGAESKLMAAVVNVLSGVSCPELEHYDVSQFEQFLARRGRLRRVSRSEKLES